MPGLRELQNQLNANLFDAEATDILSHIHAGVFDAGQRMQVYRNNVFTGFTEALRAIYPVVERLVGRGFFLYATNEYIQSFPATSGNLHTYGGYFASFLKTFEPATGLKYLPDIAKMEWHYHEVYHEHDAVPMDSHVLSKIDPARYETLRFEPNPASRLMHSAFPILDIWRVNQDDYSGNQTVDLGSGGVSLLVLRSGEEVEFHPLNEIEYEMLARIYRGQELGKCVNAVLALDRRFDLNQFLTRYITNKTLVDFCVTGESTALPS